MVTMVRMKSALSWPWNFSRALISRSYWPRSNMNLITTWVTDSAVYRWWHDGKAAARPAGADLQTGIAVQAQAHLRGETCALLYTSTALTAVAVAES